MKLICCIGCVLKPFDLKHYVAVTTYDITAYTGGVNYAGTSANVYIMLFGAYGISGEHKLANKQDVFAKGR